MLLATGGTPRALPDTPCPDGERILSWRDVYELDRAARAPGRRSAPASPARSSPAGTASSACRSRSSPAATGCCPARTPTPPTVIEQVFTSRGGTLVKRARAAAVRRAGDGVVVELRRRPDGRGLARADVRRARCPTSTGLGLEHAGVALDADGLHRGRPGVAHARPVDLRGRRLHRRAAARVGGRHAGPDRDVARARRGGGAAAAEDRRGERLHPSRRSRRSASATQAIASGHGAGPDGDAAAGHERAREDAGPPATGSSSCTAGRPPAR